MSKLGDVRLIPVHGEAGPAGHLLRSRHQWAAFDSDDKLVGVFDSINAGTTALLELATSKQLGR